MFLHTLDELDSLLAARRYCANGKNVPVEHLYETVAESRWPYENLLGIYLTNPEHAWMAVWMAITRRDRLRKRQLRYVRPEISDGDHIGRLEIYNPDNVAKEKLFCDRAHLYLFGLTRFADVKTVDISGDGDRVSALACEGFRYQTVERRGWVRNGYVLDSLQRKVVKVDAWQLAIANFGTLVPDLQVTLESDLISLLIQRVSFCPDEVGEKYLV